MLVASGDLRKERNTKSAQASEMCRTPPGCTVLCSWEAALRWREFAYFKQSYNADPTLEGGVVGQPYETRHFHLRHRHPPSRNDPLSQEQLGSVTCSEPVSDASAPAWTNGAWPPLRPVCVAQNKPSTMFSSNDQSIDLMDCMTWRFWTMKQSNSWWQCDVGSQQSQPVFLSRCFEKRKRSLYIQ